MTDPAFCLYEAVGFAASAVAAASRGDQETAAGKIAAARTAGALYQESASAEAAHALGMITGASSPARYRAPEFAGDLRSALNAVNMALLAAYGGDRAQAVTWNAVAAQAAAPLGKLAAAFAVIRNQVCAIARNAEVAS